MTGGIAVLGGATGLIEDCEFSEWALDAIWASRASSRVEVRGCRFMSSPGQAIYADKAATAIVEACDFEDVGAAVFVGDAETEALVRSSTARGCEKAALLVGGGARVVADSNAFGTSKIGILATGPETMIEISGGLLDGNETGLAVLEQARATATEVQIVGGKDCATVDGPGAQLELRGCRIHGAAEVERGRRIGATLVVDGGSIAGCQIGVLGLDPGCQVTVRRAAIHEHTGPAVSIGQHVVGEIEGNDVFDNAFPGIVTVGGRLRAFDNKVHDNRSNGIAIRGGADAVIEARDRANALPAITVVGSGTRATVSENSIRDNAGQGIYVYEGASAQVRANRVMRNGRAAITISDAGASGIVEHNIVEASGGPGLWVSDGATATLTRNTVEGAWRPESSQRGRERSRPSNVVHTRRSASSSMMTRLIRPNRLVGTRRELVPHRQRDGRTRTDTRRNCWRCRVGPLDTRPRPLRFCSPALRVGEALDIPPAQVGTAGICLVARCSGRTSSRVPRSTTTATSSWRTSPPSAPRTQRRERSRSGRPCRPIGAGWPGRPSRRRSRRRRRHVCANHVDPRDRRNAVRPIRSRSWRAAA